VITSFRMYNATPQAAAGWCALFAQVFRDVGVGIEIVEHKWPQPIEALLEELCACLAFLGVEGKVEHFAIPIAQRPATG